MSQSYQVSQGRWRMARPVGLLLAGLVLGLRQTTAAHDLFTNHVQHAVHLTIGVRYLDLTLDLTFFEEWSARERRATDADTNGRITRPELESYLKKLAPQLSRLVKLRVAGRELDLTPLYDPEMDLLANNQTGPGHHRLRLFFFAPTPTLRADDVIVIDDHLWPEAKFLGTVQQAEGRDGCTLRSEISVPANLASARPDETRSFRFHCLKPPNPKSQSENQAPPRMRVPSQAATSEGGAEADRTPNASARFLRLPAARSVWSAVGFRTAFGGVHSPLSIQTTP